MAGISLMAPFVATLIATASPNPQSGPTDATSQAGGRSPSGPSAQSDPTSVGATVLRHREDSRPSQIVHRAMHNQGDPLEIRICSDC